MQLTKAIHLVNFKKCETVIHMFKQRKGQTYEKLSQQKTDHLFVLKELILY